MRFGFFSFFFFNPDFEGWAWLISILVARLIGLKRSAARSSQIVDFRLWAGSERLPTKKTVSEQKTKDKRLRFILIKGF
jgi:hypothetical protein